MPSIASTNEVINVIIKQTNAKKSGKEWKGYCPAHDDNKPSLSISEGDDGRPLLYCHARCKYEDIVSSLGLEPSQLSPNSTQAAAVRTYKGEPVTSTYTYRDESGKALYQVLRTPSKEFPVLHRDENGKWVAGLKGVRRVLYKANDIKKSSKYQPVYVVEGEKDVDTLSERGFIATTSMGGANAKWLPEYSEALRGRVVILLPDNDKPGRDHMQEVAQALYGVAASIKVIQLEGVAEKGDVSDWFQQGHNTQELLELTKQAPEWTPATTKQEQPTAQRTSLRFSSAIELDDVEETEVTWLWDRRIPVGKITLLDGDPGLGKSVVMLAIAAHVTTGKCLPDSGFGVEGGVVIINPEDGLADTLKPRLREAGADLKKVAVLSDIKRMDEKGEEYTRLFTLQSDLDELEEVVMRKNVKLVIIDSLMGALGLETNSFKDQDVRRAMMPLAQMAERLNFAVVAIRHLNKGNSDNALYRGGGSIAFIGIARTGLMIVKDPDDEERRVLVNIKNNLSKPADSLIYQVTSKGENMPPYVQWCGKSDYTTKELTSQTKPSQGRQEILRELRASNEPLGVAELMERTGIGIEGTMRSLLSRMVNDKEIVSTARGFYSIAQRPTSSPSITQNNSSGEGSAMNATNATNAMTAMNATFRNPDPDEMLQHAANVANVALVAVENGAMKSLGQAMAENDRQPGESSKEYFERITKTLHPLETNTVQPRATETCEHGIVKHDCLECCPW